MTYRLIQCCIASYDLQIKNPIERERFPGGRYIPLPDKLTVEWYARSLAPAIGITKVEGIANRMKAALIHNSQAQLGNVARYQFASERSKLIEQEQQNQLSAMRVSMANTTVLLSAESRFMHHYQYAIEILLTFIRY